MAREKNHTETETVSTEFYGAAREQGKWSAVSALAAELSVDRERLAGALKTLAGDTSLTARPAKKLPDLPDMTAAGMGLTEALAFWNKMMNAPEYPTHHWWNILEERRKALTARQASLGHLTQ